MAILWAFLLDSFVAWLSKVVRDSVELFQEKCEELPERACPVCGSRNLIKMVQFIMVSQNINVKTVVVNSLSILLKQLFQRK